MAHQVIDMKCPGCGAPTSTGETTCKYCHRPVIISTFNSVYSMPLENNISITLSDEHIVLIIS